MILNVVYVKMKVKQKVQIAHVNLSEHSKLTENFIEFIECYRNTQIATPLALCTLYKEPFPFA
jgi:hypothetical protein